MVADAEWRADGVRIDLVEPETGAAMTDRPGRADLDRPRRHPRRRGDDRPGPGRPRPRRFRSGAGATARAARSTPGKDGSGGREGGRCARPFPSPCPRCRRRCRRQSGCGGSDARRALERPPAPGSTRSACWPARWLERYGAIPVDDAAGVGWRTRCSGRGLGTALRTDRIPAASRRRSAGGRGLRARPLDRHDAGAVAALRQLPGRRRGRDPALRAWSSTWSTARPLGWTVRAARSGPLSGRARRSPAIIPCLAPAPMHDPHHWCDILSHLGE